MATSLQERREKRANLFNQMKEVWDRTNGDPDGQDAEQWERINAELDREDAAIERAERMAKRIEDDRRPVNRDGVVAPDSDRFTEEDEKKFAHAFTDFVRNGYADLSTDDKILMRSKVAKDLPKNAAGVGTASAGGYAVPPEFRNTFIEAMKWYGPMLQEAETITTESGANLPWPTNDDTGNVGAILAENTQVTEQDFVLGTNSIDAYMYTSKLVRVSFQLLQDREDIDTWLARKLGERVGRILNAHFTTGTGVSQPDGIVTSGTVGVTGTGSFATTGGISGDNLIDMVEALDPAYAASGNNKFMGHQTVRKAVRKLKDSQNRYLWEVSLQNGVPDSLMGYQFLINNDMPTLAASSKSLLFGDIRESYIIRTVRELTAMRLSERYADFLQVGFLAFKRADGTVQNANAYRVFQTTATA